MTIVETENMTASERLRIMEALWDAICHDSAEPDSSNWHEDILSDRRKKF